LVSKFTKNPRTETSESLLLAKIWQSNDQAALGYVPRPYPGSITEFRPLKQYRMFRQPDAGWDGFPQGGRQVVVLPIYPAGMLVEPFVQHLAVALEKA